MAKTTYIANGLYPGVDFTFTRDSSPTGSEPGECACGCQKDEPAEQLNWDDRMTLLLAQQDRDDVDRFATRIKKSLAGCYLNRAESFYVSSPGPGAHATAAFNLSGLQPEGNETELSISLSFGWAPVEQVTKYMESLLSLIADKFVAECGCAPDHCQAGCNAPTENGY